jgi:tRNA 2-selenouridine synthase
MAIQKISIEQFAQMSANVLLLDVRSPSEFLHAHIPAAINLPLFIDEERKVVGTAYKQESREKAIKIGLKYFSTKMVDMVENIEKLIADQQKGENDLESNNAKSLQIVVHCWRGGMRSAGVAWLLDLYGYKVYTIVGGYKAYRNWVLQQFEKPYTFKVIGGYTGSGKTELLHNLQQQGETIIDLEDLANHKGSSFGNLALELLPTQEMFENKLAFELYKIPLNTSIWLEDESQRIGNINIPASIYTLKKQAHLYFIEIPFSERLKHIVAGYGKFEKDKLVTAIMRIKKRLGGLETKNAINFLLEDDVENCFSILLKYYDKHYLKGLDQKENSELVLHKLVCNTVNETLNAKAVLQYK